jgi:hypothetical protein
MHLCMYMFGFQFVKYVNQGVFMYKFLFLRRKIAEYFIICCACVCITKGDGWALFDMNQLAQQEPALC